VNADQTVFLALCIQVIYCFADGFGNRTHCNNNIFSIWCAIIFKRMILPTGDFGNLLHIGFNDIGNSIVKFVTRFPGLEENIGILGSTSCYGMFRIKGTIAERLKCFHIEQGSKIVLCDGLNFLNLVRGTETIEEIHKRDAALDGGEVGNATEVHHFLNRSGGKHRKTGLAARINITVITEN